MATVRQTIGIMSEITGAPYARVNQLARRLIDDGLLPKSSGKDIKHVQPSEAALLLFAVAHAERVADASAVAREFSELPYQGESTALNISAAQTTGAARKIRMSKPLSDDYTLGGFLALLLSDRVKEPCEVRLSRGSDGILRGVVTFSGAGVDHTHNFYSTPGMSGGWTFTLDNHGVDALREFLASAEADNG